MLSIVLLGTGNVSQHLFQAISKSEIASILQVYGRNHTALAYFKKEVEVITVPDQIKDADIYLIAVSDSAIGEVADLLNDKRGIVAHTSGSTSLHTINHSHAAVFYPLQTFTKEKGLDFSSIPICLEAKKEKDLSLLKELAQSLSKSVYEISTKKRKALHTAAIFANNFTNHLYHITEEICSENDVPFELLKPLIMETANKIRLLSPYEAQTGPARRNDIQTMQKHLDTLGNSLHRKIYQLISESIKATYEKEL